MIIASNISRSACLLCPRQYLLESWAPNPPCTETTVDQWRDESVHIYLFCLSWRSRSCCVHAPSPPWTLCSVSWWWWWSSSAGWSWCWPPWSCCLWNWRWNILLHQHPGVSFRCSHHFYCQTRKYFNNQFFKISLQSTCLLEPCFLPPLLCVAPMYLIE